ncbi:MAG: type IX secretion system membrane protein PorP/SprF [Bacteroidales bacterium]|nr:type IX secretion system membrane protein PorP/SprF [Bacteroidales bacterium]
MFGLLMNLNSRGQDPSFSQYYANPMYLNPALAGTGECTRLIMNYRNQWPSIPGNYITYNVSADQYFEKLSGGVGIIANSDNAGSGILNTLRVGAIYAYHLQMSRNTQLNAGIEATFHQQRLNWEDLIYPDMINPITGSVDPALSGERPPDYNSVIVPDFSAGLLFGYMEKYFIGVAADHLSQPNLKYYSNSEGNTLYIKYTVHAGAYLNLTSKYERNERNRILLSPNIMYQHQQDADQVNAGFYIERFPLVTGVWYRHNLDYADGAIFLLGIKHDRFKIGYSYDLTMSRLKASTGGSHEVSVTIFLNCNKKRNKPGAIKCPEF